MQYSINRPRPPSTWDFLQFPAWLFLYSWIGFTGLTVAIHFNQPLAYPVALAGVWAALLTVKQAGRFDASIEYVMNPVVTVNNPPQVVRELEIVKQTDNPAGRHTQYTGINLPEHEMVLLAQYLTRCDRITVRDLQSAGIKSWGDLDKKTGGVTKYAEIVDKLTAAGWVRDYKLTDEGRDYFGSKLPPRTTTLPVSQYATASLTTSDDNKTTTKRGGAK